MTYAVGCDVSRYNVSFDPSKATGQIDFAIQKATEGTGYIDLEYEAIWQGVKQAAVRGSYHYLRSGMSWLAQADHHLRTAERHSYHIHALDLEEVNNTYDDRFFADAKRVIDRWRAVSNKLAILYTNGSTFNQMVIALRRLYGSAGVLWALEVPLWIASPGIAGAPILPKYRTNGDWLIHQYSWTGMPSRWGTGGTRVDENVFNGDVTALYRRLGLTDAPPTPTEPQPGEPMARYTVTIHRDGARLRPNHDTNNTAHGTIPGGTVLPCDEVFTATTATTYQAVGDRWAKVSYAFNGITYVGWAAIIHLGNPICAIEENTTTPPATDEIFVSVEADITATVNGKQYHGAVMFDNVQLRLVE